MPLSEEARQKRNQRSIAYNKEQRRLFPEKMRVRSRQSERNRKLRKYGFTPETYEQALKKQDYCCAICKVKNNNNRDWHVDHDHKTGKTRGILCHHCNLMLGNAKDKVTILSAGISYLERYSNG